MTVVKERMAHSFWGFCPPDTVLKKLQQFLTTILVFFLVILTYIAGFFNCLFLIASLWSRLTFGSKLDLAIII